MNINEPTNGYVDVKAIDSLFSEISVSRRSYAGPYVRFESRNRGGMRFSARTHTYTHTRTRVHARKYSSCRQIQKDLREEHRLHQ